MMLPPIEIPLRDFPSLANHRGHWGKLAAIKARQRRIVAGVLRAYHPPPLPVNVHLVRIAPRMLDGDNLQGAFKAIRDELARWLCADDRPGSGITWTYEQEKAIKPRYYAAIIEVTQCTM